MGLVKVRNPPTCAEPAEQLSVGDAISDLPFEWRQAGACLRPIPVIA
jgi:hypothetical protein